MHSIRGEVTDANEDRSEEFDNEYNIEIKDYEYPPDASDAEKVAFAHAVVEAIENEVDLDVQI